MPNRLTEIKMPIWRRYSFEERLMVALFVTSIVWIRKTTFNVKGLFIGTGKSVAAFGALSFVALP